jgi:tRNA isopentenyl-2-thiomethyl-A-37 hydroxylase MiaE
MVNMTLIQEFLSLEFQHLSGNYYPKKHILMNQMTKNWWQRCLNDKEKLEHWLVSLYNNEKDAEERFINFANDYCLNDKAAYDTFVTIASQEANHAVLVEKILHDRNIALYVKSSKDGRYWRNTLECICDMKTAAAIGAYAEGLSLKRMRVIIKDPNTPADLKALFEVIEPEEAYHAKALEGIATRFGMKAVKDCHDKGLKALGLKIKNT